jgi:hypothetical protein
MNMRQGMAGDDQPLPVELQELFHSYRDSMMGIEASANFMPGLWGKIDGRRRVTHSFTRFASAFVTAAFLICLVLSGTLVTSNNQGVSTYYSYIDALDAGTADDDDFEVLPASAETI